MAFFTERDLQTLRGFVGRIENKSLFKGIEAIRELHRLNEITSKEAIEMACYILERAGRQGSLCYDYLQRKQAEH